MLTPFWPNPVCWLNTGVPHIVVEVPSTAELKKYRNEAAQIRSWIQLGPAGANVTFVHKHSGVQVSAVSFERGIENFTLACGTGAVAAASVIMANNHTSRCQVQMPGGDLQIELTDGKVLMTGEAHEIAQLTVTPAAFGWDCK